MKTHYGGGGPLDDTKLKGESAFAVAERRGIERNENGDGLFFTLSPANSLRDKLFVFLSWDNDQDLSKSGIDFQDCRAERERERGFEKSSAGLEFKFLVAGERIIRET